MRRRGAGTLLLLLIAFGVWWWWRRGDAPVDVEGRPGGAVAPLSRARGTAPGTVAPAWLGQRGLAARRVAGRVYADGAPLRGATVRLATPVGPAEWPLAEVQTDAAGGFDLGTLPAARYRLTGDAPGRLGHQLELDLRAADPTPRPDAIALHLPPCRTVVHGTIRDGAGGVIAGARVRAAGETRSDERGAYQLCVRPQWPVLRVAADGYGERLARVRVTRRTRLDVTLVPEVVIAGRVVDGPDGPPAPGVVVSVMPAGWTFAEIPSTVVVTADDGRFRVEGLAAVRVRLVARAEGRAAQLELHERVRAGANIDDVVLELAPSARIAGVVTSAGRPVAGARVGLEEARFGAVLAGDALTGADGGFTLEHTARGPVRLAVDGHEVRAPRALAAGSHERVAVEVVRLASVAGRVTRGGEPQPYAYVALSPTRTGSLTPGRASQSVVVEAGKTTAVTVVAQPMATARGLLRDLRSGAGIAGHICRVYSGSLADRGAITDEAGRFEVALPASFAASIGCDGGPFEGPFAIADTEPAAPGSTIEVTLFAYRRTHDEPSYPGIHFDPATYVVSQVIPEAAGKGFLVGDRLLAIEGLALPRKSFQLVMEVITDRAPGEPYAVTLLRDGREVTVRATNIAFPAPR